MSPELLQQQAAFMAIGEDVCQALSAYLRKLGMADEALPSIELAGLKYTQQRDPYTAEITLMGEWRSPQGILYGSVSYRADGSFYVEHDVLKAHPTDRRWIIEAITAWGKAGDIRVDPRLMAALEE